MKTEKQNYCCLCLSMNLSSAEGTIIGSDIVELLKFLVVDLNISALINSMVCDVCLSKILEAHNLKTRKCGESSRFSIKNELSSEDVMCEICEEVCGQGETLKLVDCVIQIDWSDFVNYLFGNRSLMSLEKASICASCRMSVSNIQDILKLLCVYDERKMKFSDNNAKGNIPLVGSKVEIKQEFEEHSTNISRNLTKDDKLEILCSHIKDENDISYDDFKCKNEEFDLKMECENNDGDNKANQGYKTMNISKQVISTVDSQEVHDFLKNEHCICEYDNVTSDLNCDICSIKSSSQLEEKPFGNDIKTDCADQHFKCTYCSKGFTIKSDLDHHLLNIHQYRDNITHEIFKCNICKYVTIYKSQLLDHKNIKHGKLKCQHCTYETCRKYHLIRHMKVHNKNNHNNNTNIQYFICTYCSQKFTNKQKLDIHLFKIHNCKDNLTSKIYECDKCNYASLWKKDLLKHTVTHEIPDFSQFFKCLQCPYETLIKGNLNRHMNGHKNIRNFKCTDCSREFTNKRSLDDHLLKVHKHNVASKIYKCDKCSYFSAQKTHLLRHNLTHDMNDNSQIIKCQYCTYETYNKHILTSHMKTHSNQDFLFCTYCPKGYTQKRSLDDHVLKIHKRKDNVTYKIYECDKCSYATINNNQFLQHNLKHQDVSQIFKCQQCTYETYHKPHIIRHMKMHTVLARI